MSDSKKNRRTHFGFRSIDRSAKEGLVGEVFSSVASKYDLMNDLMSGGLHRCWKNEMVKYIDVKGFGGKELRILDVAGGTGDIAFRIHNRCKTILSAARGSSNSSNSSNKGKGSGNRGGKNKGNNKNNSNSDKNGQKSFLIDVVDINPDMLGVGKDRAINRGILQGINFMEMNGENLTYGDERFDYYTIAFGIRNFTDIQKGLNEAFRVLKRGGKFICLEFSRVNSAILAQIYDFYSFKVIPKIGGVVADDRDSYQYLIESIRQFPSQEEFKSMIEKAGFSYVSYKNFTFGTVAIHIGYKA